MKIFLVILMATCFSVQAVEYEMDLTTVELEHSWRGPDNYAQFTDTLKGLGLTAWWDSGLGVRLGYLEGTQLTTDGKYDKVILDLGYIASLELLYRYEVYEGLFVLGGIGTQIIPIPNITSTDPHHANDYDNDEGYILGVQYNVSKDFSVGWRFTHYSRVKGDVYDEWTKGHSLNITYRF